MVQQLTIRMSLAQSQNENLVSRAQAKEIVREIIKYSDARTVFLDFSDIREIGQGFADELFRVFVDGHPNIDFRPINCNHAILGMIAHAKGARR